ncbi:MAG TPA: DUF2905 domain-containing protein [Thermomicrobiales bacterium]|jgi:hypothetical protein
MDQLGKILIAIGAVFICLGVVAMVAARLPFLSNLGRLPGDLVWRRGSVTIYVPIVTCLLVSLLLSLVLGLILRR